MEETYERQLQVIVDRIPAAGCVVALVPTLDDDQAAALASDAAGSIGRARRGHTLLLTLDRSGSLDHEVGVEGGPGLTEVLAGDVSLAKAAAHGRARGFIFVPAGTTPPPQAESVAASAALGRLCASAVERGATVLIHGRPGDVASLSFEPGGVVWLGPHPQSHTLPESWDVLGELLPPGPPTVAESPGTDPPGDDPVSVADETTAEADPGDGSSPPAGTHTVVRGPARSSRRRRLPGPVTITLIAVLLGAIALTAFIVGRSRAPALFLPENDSLWLAPPDATDSSAVPGAAATPEDTNP